MNPQQFPGDEANPELEALLQTNLSSDEKLTNIDQNTEGALVKMDEVAQNTEAQIVQTQKSTEELKAPLEEISASAKTIAANTEKQEVQKVKLVGLEKLNLRGPAGKTPKKGKDYYTDEERREFEDILKAYIDATMPKPGKDFYTKAEIKHVAESVVKQIRAPKDGETPKPGIHYPTKAELFKYIKETVAALPEPEPGEPGKDADPAEVARLLKRDAQFVDQLKGKDAVFTQEERETLQSEVYARTVEGVRRIISSKTYSLSELDDVDPSGLEKRDGKFILRSGPSIFYSASPPESPAIGDLWVVAT